MTEAEVLLKRDGEHDVVGGTHVQARVAPKPRREILPGIELRLVQGR